jgi:hypothetical protein
VRRRTVDVLYGIMWVLVWLSIVVGSFYFATLLIGVTDAR